MFGRAYCQSGGFGAGHVSWGNRIRVFGGRCKPRPGDHETSQALDSRPRIDEDAVLSRNDSIGSVVLAESSSARASLLARYGPSIGPRLTLASSCKRIHHAIPFLPTESFRPSRNDAIGPVVLAASSSARASLLARYGPSIGPRLALASSCERIRDAIPFLPTESFLPARGLRLTLGVDRDLLFSSCDPVTPLPSLLGTDDFSGARGRCGWKTGIGIQCESKVESSQPRPASGLPGH